MRTWKRMLLAAVFGTATLVAGGALAQTYPSKPIRLIVPFPTGSSADVFARTIGTKLHGALGQPVVVENRPGANGIIGTQAVAKAAPDGYTIGLGSTGTHAINVSLFEKLPYNPVADFAPVINAYGLPYLLLAPATGKAATFKELVAELRANAARKMSIGSFATGAQLTGELLRQSMALPLTPISYKTQSNAVNDLIGGHLELMVDTISGGQSSIATGRVKALAITSSKRSPLLPNVPTVAESGHPGFVSTAWVGLFAPAGTPAAIVDQLNAAVTRILRIAEVRDQLLANGIEPIGSTPGELQATVKSEIDTWARVFKEAGLPKATN
jgi:tripartite-type tricarboxylate transporter receptor subunit TctC